MVTTGKCAADIIAGCRQEALWRYFEAGGGGAEEVVEILSDVSHYSTGVRGQRDSCIIILFAQTENIIIITILYNIHLKPVNIYMSYYIIHLKPWPCMVKLNRCTQAIISPEKAEKRHLHGLSCIYTQI